MLDLKYICRSFGDVRVLDGVSLRSGRGSVHYCINRLGIGRTFLYLRLATQMTVSENIMLAMETKLFACPTKEKKKQNERYAYLRVVGNVGRLPFRQDIANLNADNEARPAKPLEQEKI